jgi:hypothetical protein
MFLVAAIELIGHDFRNVPCQLPLTGEGDEGSEKGY